MSVRREEVEKFVNKYGPHVRLVKSGRFGLTGVIEEIYIDSLLFTTQQETSIISFETIEEIRTATKGRWD